MAEQPSTSKKSSMSLLAVTNEQLNAEMFEKCFLYQRNPTKEGTWCLPKADALFTEYYQLESLQNLKVTLNKVKSKLNDYDIEKWSIHTRRQDPAGDIPRRLKMKNDAEFVTGAWCKMYECLGRFPDLLQGPEMNSLHLCEAPGAFITALNHYLYATYDEKKVQWNWLATTLNPYYEGNTVDNMIMDDRFLLCTMDKWVFHEDFTGNIIDTKNLKHMKEQCEKRLGDVHLITADGSVDCVESPDCQEEKVALLHYAEILTALSILANGGSFIIKMFTMYEASSINKLYLLNCVFEKVYVFKPCTSKRGNSEVYIVCLNYNKNTKNLTEILKKMETKLNRDNSMLCPLFEKSFLPVEFLKQHEICCRLFMNYQINAIEKNIYAYKIKLNKTIIKRLQDIRIEVCDEFYKRYKIKKIPNEKKILYKCKTYVDKIYRNQLHKGSHSEREMLKETSKEEQIYKFREHLNEVEEFLREHLLLTNEVRQLETKDDNVTLTIYRGKSVVNIKSSLFANVDLLIMRNKLNDLYKNEINDCFWLCQPRLEFKKDTSSTIINFNDFYSNCGNFSIQQEHFFKCVIAALLKSKPNEIKFINMPFLTHYAVSLLRYLSCLAYSNFTFSMNIDSEIILSTCTEEFTSRLEELKVVLFSSLDYDILCFIQLPLLHRNEFNTTLCAFNNMLLLQKYKHLLYTYQ